MKYNFTWPDLPLRSDRGWDGPAKLSPWVVWVDVIPNKQAGGVTSPMKGGWHSPVAITGVTYYRARNCSHACTHAHFLKLWELQMERVYKYAQTFTPFLLNSLRTATQNEPPICVYHIIYHVSIFASNLHVLVFVCMHAASMVLVGWFVRPNSRLQWERNRGSCDSGLAARPLSSPNTVRLLNNSSPD